MLRYPQKWIDQLRWPRLKPMEKLAGMLLAHLEGILNYCRTKVRWGWWKPSTTTSKLCSAAAAVVET